MSNPRMNRLLAVAVCVALVGGMLLLVDAASSGSSQDWLSYKQQHGKNYASRAEDAMRRAVFVQTKAKIEKFNAEQSQKLGYKLGLSHLSDRTEAEMGRRLGLRMPKDFADHKNSLDDQLYVQQILERPTEVPDELDYSKQANRVTPVKDQGDCKSGWAFATTGVLEGQEATAANESELVGLSEQNIIDCDIHFYVDAGCDGGWMANGLIFVYEQGGIDDEQSYPYIGVSDSGCKFEKSKVALTDYGATVLKDMNEEHLKELVAKFGPVAVAMWAPKSFHHYKRGVYFDNECVNVTSLNHAALIVGYGTDAAAGDYWLVKNSWGSHWGEGGYIRIARNRNNHCGITWAPTIPKFV